MGLNMDLPKIKVGEEIEPQPGFSILMRWYLIIYHEVTLLYHKPSNKIYITLYIDGSIA